MQNVYSTPALLLARREKYIYMYIHICVCVCVCVCIYVHIYESYVNLLLIKYLNSQIRNSIFPIVHVGNKRMYLCIIRSNSVLIKVNKV